MLEVYFFAFSVGVVVVRLVFLMLERNFVRDSVGFRTIFVVCEVMGRIIATGSRSPGRCVRSICCRGVMRIVVIDVEERAVVCFVALCWGRRRLCGVGRGIRSVRLRVDHVRRTLDAARGTLGDLVSGCDGGRGHCLRGRRLCVAPAA